MKEKISGTSLYGQRRSRCLQGRSPSSRRSRTRSSSSFNSGLKKKQSRGSIRGEVEILGNQEKFDNNKEQLKILLGKFKV